MEVVDWSKATPNQLLLAAYPGLGATKHVGSDSYGYYVCAVDPEKKMIGLYAPDSHFEHDWTDGHEVTDPFEPGHEPELVIQLFRGKWYEWDKGTLKRTNRKVYLCWGYCSNYRDPSF